MAKRTVIGYDSDEAFERVANATKRVERELYAPRAERARYPISVKQFTILVCKADDDYAKGETGTFSVWSGTASASLSDTGDNVEAYARMNAVVSGAWCYVSEFPWGYEVIFPECPDA